MPAYNFDERHECAIASGEKARTIRPIGKRRHAEAGDELCLYVAMRTQRARLVRVAVCTASRSVELEISMSRVVTAAAVDGAPVGDIDRFARLDGFRDAAAMGEFFAALHGRGTFRGRLIEWSAR